MQLASRRFAIILLVILAVQLALLIVSIPRQRLHGDEAWLGEQAYFLRHEGVCRSELFRGFAGQEQMVLVTHKLFIVLGATAVAAFGWGVWQLRLLSLAAGAVTLMLLVRHMRTTDKRDNEFGTLLAILFLAASPLFFKFINLYRPEVMLAAFGFGSFYCLSRALEDKGRGHLILAAITAGAAVLVHLNGLMFVVAGLAVLLYERRFRSAAGFVFLSLLVSAFYFADVVGHWDLFLHQFASVPSLTPDDFHWDAPFWRLLNEHKRLFRKPEIIFSSALFFGSAGYYWHYAGRRGRAQVFYAIALIVTLGAIGQAKTTPYAIALLPVFAVVVARATAMWWHDRRRYPRAVSILAVSLWSAFIIHGLAADALNATTGKRDVAAESRQMAAYVPPGTAVLAPMDFIFDEIQHFRIRALLAAELTITQDASRRFDMENVTAYADAEHIPTIILDHDNLIRLGLEGQAVGRTFGGYQLVAHIPVPDCMIFKKQEG